MNWKMWLLILALGVAPFIILDNPDPVGHEVCPKAQECAPPLWSQPADVGVILDDGPPF